MELAFRLLGGFDYRRRPDSPSLDRERPFVLVAGDTRVGERSVGFVVHVGIRLDAERFAAYRHLPYAIVVTIEAPHSGRSCATRLIDPDPIPADSPWPNFLGEPSCEPGIVFHTQWITAAIQLGWQPEPGGLWIQAFLHSLRSTRVHLAFPL